MASMPMARIGDSFKGVCSICGAEVTGTLTSNGAFVTVEGKEVAVTGTIGTGSCGHTCTVIGQSTVLKIEDKEVARQGDPVTGIIEGEITSGCDFISTE